MNSASLVVGLLMTTCLMHWVTVLLLLRRGRLTEKPLVGNLLGLAVGLLAVQQTYMLVDQFIDQNPPALSVVSGGLSLLVAGLLLGGMLQVFPFLHLLQRNKELLAVIEERNVIIHQFHERIARALQKIQIAMEVGKPIHFIIEQVAEMSLMLQVFLEDLRAGVLLGNKFEVALKTLVEDVSRDASFPFTVHVDPSCEDAISREQGVALLHIVREALHNSVQHSEAKKGQVTAKTTGQEVVLEIFDNGKGFEMDLVRAQGQGLGSMVNRAKKIGARLKIHSHPLKGTSVIIEIPLNRTPSDSTSTPAVVFSNATTNTVRRAPVA